MTDEKNVEMIALETLRSKAQEIGLDVPFDLIAEIYDVERDHQYDEDRQYAIQRIKEIVEKHLQGARS